MNILLVYPKYPDTYWSFKHVLNFISSKAAFPPLGLLTVGSLLPEAWNKKLVDLNVTELKDEEIDWADMVFISAMIVQTDSAREVIHRCKARGRTTVAGGPAATIMHDKLMDVDHLVLNEAEITLPLFLEDFQKGKPKAIYKSSERADITMTPLPMWSLIDFKDYATMPIQYSRGCPFNCEFCDIIVMYGRTPRTKSTEQLIREMQLLYDAGWKGSVFIVDDNFIGNKVSVKNMLPALSRWQKQHKHPFAFTTEASTNLAEDEELMQMMSEANFEKVFVGIETPSIDSLKECGKYQNTSHSLEDAVIRIQQNGMQVMGGFIVGFDNDTDSIFDAQIRFIQKVGIVIAMVGLLNALPQTRLWNRLKAEKRLLYDTSGENTDSTLNFIPVMATNKLLAGYQEVVSTIYTPRKYYERIHTFIRHYKPRTKTRITIREIMATLRSMWHIGVMSRARFYYWQLIIKTGLRRIKSLPAAIELAIYGLHFEKVSARVMNETRE